VECSRREGPPAWAGPAPAGRALRERTAAAPESAAVADSAAPDLDCERLKVSRAPRRSRKVHQAAKPQQAPPSKAQAEPFPVRFEDTWYNLARWRERHPVGAHFIDFYEGRDATEAIHAFHGESARQMVRRLPLLDAPAAAEREAEVGDVSEVTKAFRALRGRLWEEGWWERDLWQEAKWLGIWAALCVCGLGLAHLDGWLSALAVPPLALAMVAGAWLGHDYAHGVDDFSRGMRLFAPLAIGISPTWWSEKHNKHHALTNQMGADPDISMPPLFIWPPHTADDMPAFRSLQHRWYPLGCAMIFISWRFRSLHCVATSLWEGRRGAVAELAALAVHWTVLLACVPVPLLLAATSLAGLVCGLILMTSHLGEELYGDFQDDWVQAQFCSTRGAVTRSSFTEWLWGGMQYHLEHHLFPSMPRSRYPQLRPLLQHFAAEQLPHGTYRVDDELAMLDRTWHHLRTVACAPDGGSSALRIRDGLHPTGLDYGGRAVRLPSHSSPVAVAAALAASAAAVAPPFVGGRAGSDSPSNDVVL